MTDVNDKDTAAEENAEELFDQMWGSGTYSGDALEGTDDSNEVKDEETPDGETTSENTSNDSEDNDTDDERTSSEESDVQAAADSSDGDDDKNQDDDPYSWIDALEDDDVKTRAKDLFNELKADRGRVSALTKKAQSLEARIAAEQANEAPRPSVASDADVEDEALGKELEDLRTELKENYPSLGGNVDALFDHYERKVLASVEKKLTPIQKRLNEENAKGERQRLADMSSRLFNTPETGITYKDVVESDHYKEWLSLQPSYVQKAAAAANTAEVAYEILEAFTEDFVKDVEDDNPEELTDEAAAKKAQKAKERRKEAEKTSVTPKSKTAGLVEEQDEDYEAIFNRMYGDKK